MLSRAAIIIMRAKSLQSCPTLCDPIDCSLPGSSVHGILQARILEQVAMPASRVEGLKFPTGTSVSSVSVSSSKKDGSIRWGSGGPHCGGL